MRIIYVIVGFGDGGEKLRKWGFLDIGNNN